MSSAGKTKLLTRYLYKNYLDEGWLTLAIDCSPVIRPHARYVYYDTAGQDIYRSILNLYMKGTDAALLIYSVSDYKSFEELLYYKKRVEE